MGIATKNITIGVLLIALFFSGYIYATGEGFYMGLQVGQSNLNNESELVKTGSNGIDSDFPVDNAIDSPACDYGPSYPGCIRTAPTDKGVGFRLFVGSAFSKYAAVETGLSYFSPSIYQPDVDFQTHEPQIRAYAADIVGKGTLPIWIIGVFAKVGVAFLYTSSSSALFVDNDDSNSGGSVTFHPTGSLGVSFDITPRWVVDLSYTRILKADNIPDVDFIALGISYHWVDLFCGQFLC